MSHATPADRKFVKTHEWVKIEGTRAIVGITDHAQEALGDITFVELPNIGKKVNAGDSCAMIESVKAASDIYSPVAGEVAEVNTLLTSKPEEINADPYTKGWLFVLQNIDAASAASLLDSKGYDAFVESEK